MRNFARLSQESMDPANDIEEKGREEHAHKVNAQANFSGHWVTPLVFSEALIDAHGTGFAFG